MASISLDEFMHLVGISQARRRREHQQPNEREFVLRPNQNLWQRRQAEHRRHLATCPGCDAVIAAELLHPRSGLCPRCHDLHHR